MTRSAAMPGESLWLIRVQLLPTAQQESARLSKFRRDLGVDPSVDSQTEANQHLVEARPVVLELRLCGLASPNRCMVRQSEHESKPVPRLIRRKSTAVIAGLPARRFIEEMERIEAACSRMALHRSTDGGQRSAVVQQPRTIEHGGCIAARPPAWSDESVDDLLVSMDGIEQRTKRRRSMANLRHRDMDMMPGRRINSAAEIATDVKSLGNDLLPMVYALKDACLQLDALPTDSGISALASNRGVILDGQVNARLQRTMAVASNNGSQPVGVQDLGERPANIIAAAVSDLRNGELVLDSDAAAAVDLCGQQRSLLAAGRMFPLASRRMSA